MMQLETLPCLCFGHSVALQVKMFIAQQMYSSLWFIDAQFLFVLLSCGTILGSWVFLLFSYT